MQNVRSFSGKREHVSKETSVRKESEKTGAGNSFFILRRSVNQKGPILNHFDTGPKKECI